MIQLFTKIKGFLFDLSLKSPIQPMGDVDLSEQETAILDLVSKVGTIVVSVAFAIGVIIVAVNIIKSALILADADKAGPEQTAKAKTAIKNNVIALLIMCVPFVVLVSGFQTWIRDIVEKIIGGLY